MNGFLYDVAIGLVEKHMLASLRQQLLAPLRGTVVDLGAGTGANFRYFSSKARVVAFEPDRAMAGRARSKIASSEASIDLRIADDRGLETFPAESVDAVVMTLVLCTVVDPRSALLQARRILRPAGMLVLMEHVRSAGAVGRFQDLAAPLWRRIADGCHLDRDTAATVASVGFDTAPLKTKRLPKIFAIQEIISGRLHLLSQ